MKHDIKNDIPFPFPICGIKQFIFAVVELDDGYR